MPLFSIHNVHFRNLLHYPQIDIMENRATFICGKSGSGKSTLLKLLNATLSPDDGELLYLGKPIHDYDTIALRREVLLVSQTVFLFDESIEKNFESFYRYRELAPPNEEKIRFYLRLSLADFPLNAHCRTLSGGERQRVFIAICLSLSPKVFLLDEPTSALDGQTAMKLMSNLKSYCAEKHITLIAITHDRTLAEQCADNIVCLDSEVHRA